MKGPLFYAKILLFGEYGIIKDSKGLAIPFNAYRGALKSSKDFGSNILNSFLLLKLFHRPPKAKRNSSFFNASGITIFLFIYTIIFPPYTCYSNIFLVQGDDFLLRDLDFHWFVSQPIF